MMKYLMVEWGREDESGIRVRKDSERGSAVEGIIGEVWKAMFCLHVKFWAAANKYELWWLWHKNNNLEIFQVF